MTSGVFSMNHLNQINENYCLHAIKAIGFGVRLFMLSIAAIIHAVFPNIMVTTVSNGVENLNDELSARDIKPGLTD